MNGILVAYPNVGAVQEIKKDEMMKAVFEIDVGVPGSGSETVSLSPLSP